MAGAGDAGGARDLGTRRRTEDAYLDRITRVGGAELRERVADSPAYPALMGRLDELARRGVNERELLTQAVRERELTTAQDPAAVLVHRIDAMTEMDSDDAMTRSLSGPSLDSDDIMRKALDDDRRRDQSRTRERERGSSIADDFGLGLGR